MSFVRWLKAVWSIASLVSSPVVLLLLMGLFNLLLLLSLPAMCRRWIKTLASLMWAALVRLVSRQKLL